MNELIIGQLAFGLIAPVDARLVVQAFGKSLGKAVGNRLDHDRAVGVVCRFKLRGKFIRTMNANDKAADVIRGGDHWSPLPIFAFSFAHKFPMVQSCRTRISQNISALVPVIIGVTNDVIVRFFLPYRSTAA